MAMIEVLTGDNTVKQLASGKIEELKEMQATNPIVKYEAFEKDGEIMLDFLLSENSADGKSIIILERNVYRYKAVTASGGQKAVLLFAVSERAYGNDATPFLKNLKARRSELVNQVAAYKMPSITIAK
jgi:hypothetical protein